MKFVYSADVNYSYVMFSLLPAFVIILLVIVSLCS